MDKVGAVVPSRKRPRWSATRALAPNYTSSLSINRQPTIVSPFCTGPVVCPWDPRKDQALLLWKVRSVFPCSLPSVHTAVCTLQSAGHCGTLPALVSLPAVHKLLQHGKQPPCRCNSDAPGPSVRQLMACSRHSMAAWVRPSISS